MDKKQLKMTTVRDFIVSRDFKGLQECLKSTFKTEGTELEKACELGDVRVIRLLLEIGINRYGVVKCTIHSTVILKLLLQYGIELDKRKTIRSCLYNYNMVKLLSEYRIFRNDELARDYDICGPYSYGGVSDENYTIGQFIREHQKNEF